MTRQDDNKFVTTQPPEWQEAFKKEAKLRKMSLSEWVGECCWYNLRNRLRVKLPERRKKGRPKS